MISHPIIKPRIIHIVGMIFIVGFRVKVILFNGYVQARRLPLVMASDERRTVGVEIFEGSER